MKHTMRSLLTVVAIWLMFGVMIMIARPLLPIDETRYAAVAWEMRTSGDYLVPHLNGEPYAHKPPLLFWAMNAAWSVFGVHERVAQAVGPFFALGASLLTIALGGMLWPGESRVAARSGVALSVMPVFVVYGTALMFDALLTCLVLIALCGVVYAARGRYARGLLLLALGVGGGILAKGPVAMVYVVPAAIGAPWCFPRSDRRSPVYYGAIASGLIAGCGIALLWAIPAALHGGADYRQEILWGQTAGRVSNSFAHRQPFWFYFLWLPLALIPWACWRRVWVGIREVGVREPGMRFALVWSVAALVTLSVVSGKQLHYLMPILPAAALVFARGLSAQSDHRADRPRLIVAACTLVVLSAGTFAALSHVMEMSFLEGIELSVWPAFVATGVIVLVAAARWRNYPVATGAFGTVTVATGISLGAIAMAAGPIFWNANDTQLVAKRIAALQESGVPVVCAELYRGQYTFEGRLHEPLRSFEDEAELLKWCEEFPDGRVVEYWRGDVDPYPGETELIARYRLSKTVGIVHAHGLLAAKRAGSE